MEGKSMLNELRDEIYDDAVKHGLWDEMHVWKLIATNEDFRKSGIADVITYANSDETRKNVIAALFISMEIRELIFATEDTDHFREELADVIITALSAAGYLGIDIDKAVRQKMEINRGREWRHGK
jgi:NTP pyrophosphatase (non-canonical NTP hydrolase)